LQVRHLPQRTCIACRSTGEKRGLIRIVRLAATAEQGSVEVDLTGKKPGRGAYICPRPSCWESALKKGRLESALRTTLTPDDKMRLAEFATTLENAVAI
jgi:predicted RNA-binding protein YlxR (DUF448 family)